MTEPILQYVRDRIYAQGRVPEGQLALFDIVTELARRIDALEAVQPAMPELEQRARNEWLDERLNHLQWHMAAVLDRLQIPGHRSVVGRAFVPPQVTNEPAPVSTNIPDPAPKVLFEGEAVVGYVNPDFGHTSLLLPIETAKALHSLLLNHHFELVVHVVVTAAEEDES